MSESVRLALLADTHGNLPALEAVLTDVRTQGVDGLIVAGDFTGGPQPQETVDLLRSLGASMIRGNAEDYVLAWHSGAVPEAWRTNDQFATLRWSCLRLDGPSVDFIAGLPGKRVLALDGTASIRVVHGTPQDPNEFLVPEGDRATLDLFRRAELLTEYYKPVPVGAVLARVQESVLVSAHSHIPWLQERGGRLVVNVGSVGAPNNGDVRAQYALLVWTGGRWRARLRAVPYDLDRIRAAYRDTGLLAEGGVMAEAFLLGVVTGQNIPGRFAAHVSRLAAAAGTPPGAAVPGAVWRKAVATFDWPASDLPESLELLGGCRGRGG